MGYVSMAVIRSAKAVHEDKFLALVALQDSYAWLENCGFLLFWSDRQKVSTAGRSYVLMPSPIWPKTEKRIHRHRSTKMTYCSIRPFSEHQTTVLIRKQICTLYLQAGKIFVILDW